MKQLEIGRRSKRSGWVTLDWMGDPDIIAELPELPPEVLLEEWDTIVAIHVFEHLHRDEALKLLRAVYSALKVGGQLILEMPNIEFAAKVLLGLEPYDVKVFGMRAFYGDANRNKPEMLHRWGWSPATLQPEFLACGFSEVRIERAKYHFPDRDFRIVGIK